MGKRIISVLFILLISFGLYAETSSKTTTFDAYGYLNRTINKYAYLTITTEGYNVGQGNKLYLSNNILGSSESDAKTIFSWDYSGNIYRYSYSSSNGWWNTSTKTVQTLSLSFTFHALQKVDGTSDYINFYYAFKYGDTTYSGTAPGTDTITGYIGGTKQSSNPITGTTNNGTNVTIKYTYKNSCSSDSSIIWTRPGEFSMYIPSTNISGKTGEYSSLVTVTIATE